MKENKSFEKYEKDFIFDSGLEVLPENFHVYIEYVKAREMQKQTKLLTKLCSLLSKK